jgi:hypothetical protein
MKYKNPKIQADGRTEPIYPKMTQPYKMQCCDCGLVHNLEFFIEREIERHGDGSFDSELVNDTSLRVMFVVSRNTRATGQIRRHKNVNHIEKYPDGPPSLPRLENNIPRG